MKPSANRAAGAATGDQSGKPASDSARNFGSNFGNDQPSDLDAWITRDQRELPLIAMENEHLHSAIASLTRWRSHEQDDDRRDELKRWIHRFKAELKTRIKAAERELKRRQTPAGDGLRYKPSKNR
jgi:hypothetical protein